MDWQVGMDEFRHGTCQWRKKAVDSCGIRDSMEISCVYRDVIVPVLFILQRRGCRSKEKTCRASEHVCQPGYSIFAHDRKTIK
jgi:hypothetical protein